MLTEGGSAVSEFAKEFLHVEGLEVLARDGWKGLEFLVFLNTRELDVVAVAHLPILGEALAPRLDLRGGATAHVVFEALLCSIADGKGVFQVTSDLQKSLLVGSRKIHASRDLGDGDLENCNQTVQLGEELGAVGRRTQCVLAGSRILFVILVGSHTLPGLWGAYIEKGAQDVPVVGRVA